MYNIKHKLPKKGKDIVGIDEQGKKSYIFRCNCHNPYCMEWRCSLTGLGVFKKIIKWRYIKYEN